MRSARDDSAYQIHRHRLFLDLDEQRRTYDTADVFFVYSEDRDDYLQVPSFDRNTVGTRPHFSYIEDYDYARSLLLEFGSVREAVASLQSKTFMA
jgi:hypothetical protein